ncbi:hypothetical protein F511_05079 [Dorcoceras hygrometricum]|uniref:ETFB lysine methyltransferase n=1 Tax=Dorcoceras hygrometricum TaxID=472368 RepID=A0A2Z7AQU7_9LAMI|nr:hypothetical protein F511_05079 [Dorcoceras hygrometricum]
MSYLGGHFFKHLTSSISTRAPPNRLASIWSAKYQQQSHNFAANSYSLNGGSITGDDSPYLSVRICCPNHAADAFSESLMCFGASSTTIDLQDYRDSDKQIWITSIFNISQDVKGSVSLAADSVGLKEMPTYEVEMLDHTDWIKQTQESFHPMEIIDGIWIVPEWRSPPNPHAINIILNPGLAFGTGDHPTTKLCLLLLHRSIKGGESFLDYGTGSGILAIAALKFGAELSVGLDIEPQAITSAMYNAALNNIGPDKLLLSLVPSKNSPQFENEAQNEISTEHDSSNLNNIFVKEKYDVVIANILLYPLLDLADRIVSYAMPGAAVGISGIISEQVPSVVEHYSQFLDDIRVKTMEDWACISGSKKRNS